MSDVPQLEHQPGPEPAPEPDKPSPPPHSHEIVLDGNDLSAAKWGTIGFLIGMTLFAIAGSVLLVYLGIRAIRWALS